MKQLSPWLEAVGVVAIVISLVLVGIEIRQNTNAVSAQAVLALHQEHNESDRLLINNPEFVELLVRAEATPDPPSEADVWRLERFTRTLISIHTSAYVFYSRGLLDDAEYLRWRMSACQFVTHPKMHAYWVSSREYTHPEFVRDVESRCQQRPDGSGGA